LLQVHAEQLRLVGYRIEIVFFDAEGKRFGGIATGVDPEKFERVAVDMAHSAAHVVTDGETADRLGFDQQITPMSVLDEAEGIGPSDGEG
jgi:hypothetical protein